MLAAIVIYLIILIALSLAYLLYCGIANYLWLQRMKRKHGNNAIYIYHPLLGFAKLIINSVRNRSSFSADILDLLHAQSPDAKAIFSASAVRCAILLLDPEIIKEVLNEKHTYYKKNVTFYLDQIIGEGLAISDGSQWKRQRLLLSTPFHFNQLKGHIPTVLKVTQKNIQKIINFSPEYAKGEGIDTMDLSQRLTGEVIFERFFGYNLEQVPLSENVNLCNEVSDVLNDSYALIRDPGHIVKLLIFGECYWNKFYFIQKHFCSLLSKKQQNLVKRVQALQQMLLTLIEQRIAQSKQQQLGDSLLDVLVKDYVEYANDRKLKELAHQCLTFFFAGVDTTSTLITQCLYYLGCHKEMQDQLYEEFKSVNFLEGQEEKISNLRYANLFVRETLRLSGIASAILPRNAVKDHTIGTSAGHIFEVQKGVGMNILQNVNEMNEKYFEQPERFWPERWEQEKVRQLHPYISVPFSAGPRNCIGQHLAQIETKIVLAQILKRFIVELNPACPRKMHVRLIYQPLDGHLNIFRQRDFLE